MKKRSLILLMGMLLPASTAWASNLPESELIPGGIAVFTISPANQPEPEVRFGRQRAMVVQDKSYWKAVVGLPLGLLPGEYIYLTKTEEEGEFFSEEFEVLNKQYPSERVAAPKSKNQKTNPLVAPTRKELRAEHQEISGVFRDWKPLVGNPLPLLPPANGRIIGHFGKRRFSSEEEGEPYTGVDFIVPPGSLIYAPADGTIAAIGNYPTYGNSMLIEHGEGLVSMINGMRDTTVKKGDSVTRGQIIGKSGEDGSNRVEWKISLNDARVNPLILLEQPKSEQTAKKADEKSPESKKK